MSAETQPQPAPFMVYTTQRFLGYPLVVFEVRQVTDDIAIGVAEAQGMARESVPMGELRVPVVELIRPTPFPYAWRLAPPDTFRTGRR